MPAPFFYVEFHKKSPHQKPSAGKCIFYLLLAPNFLGDFLHERQLLPLILVREQVALLSGSKSALRAERQLIQRNILLRLTNAGDDCIITIKILPV